MGGSLLQTLVWFEYMNILISGPAGAGKSTVSKLLCEHLKKCALIEVDKIRNMIKSGHVSPFEENEESEKQLELGIKNTCSLVNNFNGDGFNVVIDDVVSTTERLNLYFEKLGDLPVFLLLPNEDVIIHRDSLRDEDNQMKNRAIELHKRFQKLVETEHRWTIIDSSKQTANETVEIILKSYKKFLH